MTAGIMQFIFQIIVWPANWALEIFSATGMFGFFLVCFLVYRLSSLLLAPLIGRAGSDTAKRSRDKED